MQDALIYLEDLTLLLLTMPINSGEKFYYLYVLTFIALAWLSFYRYYRHRTRKKFLQFLFPKQIYWHKSARIDYAIFLINVALSPLFLIGVGLQTWISNELASSLIALNDGAAIFTGEWQWLTYALFIFGYTLSADLSVYLIHRFHHRSNVFWPLHALHHSAEVMTPVTLFRKHPLWNLSAHSLTMIMTGLFQGLFVFVFFGNPGFEILFGLNTLYVLYNFFGANLRHSHVWLHWPKPFAYLFISPAMHQIHHDPTRLNKNYGEVFAIWDWLFGSLYIPDGYEEFAIGLGADDNPHHTVSRAYWLPLAEFTKRLAQAAGRRSPR
ncbi:MAG: sterol desaturase family protein [Pseudomonadales bacterium]|nr:sterol desaturase family protein [Pseudomonadales bacterium]